MQTPTDKVNALVQELLVSHGGGSEYFTALDARLLTPEYDNVVKALFDPAPHNVVVTGKFGEHVFSMVSNNRLTFTGELLWFSGGLRIKAPFAELLGYAGQHNYGGAAQAYTFIDDSFYSGKTLYAISGALNQRDDGFIKHARVVYDGSIVRPSLEHLASFESLYRYHK